MKLKITLLASMGLIFSTGGSAIAQEANFDRESNTCAMLTDHAALKAAPASAVAYSGMHRGTQWPGSRVISAQKANTGNAFSLDMSSSSGGSGQLSGLALSIASLYSAAQPGASLFGLQFSNPVDTRAAYAGTSAQYGTAGDPMVGQKIGGVNVFGGWGGLYGAGKSLVGGLGVSGDTSCADHFIGWRVRHILKLDHLGGVGGVSGDAAHPDNIIFDITASPNGGTGISAGGFGHPSCINTGDPSKLPAVIQ